MNKNEIKEISLDAMLLAMLIIGSKISIPLGIINLTLQLPVVFLIIFLCNKKDSIFIISTYLIIGLIGIPVFSTGGGFTYLFKPSFGYIIGFLVAAILIPSSLNRGYFYLINIAIGIIIVYAFGSIYMYLILNYYMGVKKGIGYVLSVAVLPFVVKDLICAYAASIIAVRIRNIYIKKFETIEFSEN